MERRELLKVVGLASATAIAGKAFAQQEHHNHGPAHAALMDAALDCVKTGDVCLDHCLQSLAAGDKSLAECARSVNDLVAVCGALAKLASSNSALLPKYAALVKVSCESCEKVCRKHEGHHAACKACADACVTCARECAKLA